MISEKKKKEGHLYQVEDQEKQGEKIKLEKKKGGA